MNKLKIATLLTALIAVNSTAKPTSARTPLKFYVDSEVLTEYSKDEVYDKISTLITHNNDALRNTGVQRTVSSIDFIRSKNSFKDPRIELHALLSKKENHAKVFDLFFEDEAVYDRINKRNIRRKPPAYTVFMGLPREPIASCGAAPEPSKEYELTDKERITVLAFDMHGECSFDWLLTHELGHIDGLGHVSNQCTDGSKNIMAPKADKSVRHHFTGSQDCPTIYATNHTKKYKELVPSLVKYSFRAKPLIFNKKEQPITFSNIRLSTDTSSSIALLFDVEHNLRTSKKIHPKISYIAYEKGKKVRKTHKLNPIQLSPRRKKQTVVADFVDNSLIQPFVAIENGEGSIMY